VFVLKQAGITLRTTSAMEAKSSILNTLYFEAAVVVFIMPASPKLHMEPTVAVLKVGEYQTFYHSRKVSEGKAYLQGFEFFPGLQETRSQHFRGKGQEVHFFSHCSEPGNL